MELAEVKRKLSDIFVYYAQFGDRLNTVNLKSQTFHRMLKEAGIVEAPKEGRAGVTRNESMFREQGITKKRGDLIFCSVNRSKVNMVFETFL